MEERKNLKERAHINVKKHYGLFLIICLFSAFIGSEFVTSLTAAKENEFNFEDVLVENVEKGSIEDTKIETQQSINQIQENAKDEEVLGRSRGVFSLIINSIESGSIYLVIINAVTSIVKSTNVAIIILILLSLLISFLVWLLFINTFKVVSRRIFLEGRIYDNISKQRFLYLFKTKKVWKTAKTMFLVSLYETLWLFTIVGGIIKKYSYYLVPYIVAENPNISSRDAIKLSREMMNGYKWKCFVAELSFIFWDILGFCTIGLSNIFYTDLYKTAFFTEWYVSLRGIAKEKKTTNSELLSDKYLFEKCNDKQLSKEYKDVINKIKTTTKFDEEKGIKGFLVKYVGVRLFKDSYYEEYDQNEFNKLKIKGLKFEASGEAYPNRLSIVEEKERHKGNSNYLRHYSILSIVLIFFLISFIGWIWEVSLHLVQDGVFVNRGTMFGPWLPIYGGGSILILICLYYFRKRPVFEFISTVILCGITEYTTAWYLEVFKGMKWWDYSGYFLNLDGRICAEGLLVFGLGGFAVIYALAPAIDSFIKKINKKITIPIAVILLTLFMIDKVYSSKHPNVGKGITDYSSKNYINISELQYL